MRSLLLIVALSFVLCSPPPKCPTCQSCEDFEDKIATISEALSEEKSDNGTLRARAKWAEDELKIYRDFKQKHDDEFLIWDTKRKIDSLQTILNEKR